jgi:hypothetical protein
VRDESADHGCEYLGNGPVAISAGGAGTCTPTYLGGVSSVATTFLSTRTITKTAVAGDTHKDHNAARFGSSLGDSKVEIYRRT